MPQLPHPRKPENAGSESDTAGRPAVSAGSLTVGRSVRMAWESNRGLPGAIRAMHAAAAPWTPVCRWLWKPERRHTTVALGSIALVWLVVYPLDGAIATAATSLRDNLGGDIRREFETFQQFGGLTSCLLVAAVVWGAMPGERPRLRGLAASWIVVGLVVQMLKMLIGRPRPKFGDPDTILGPLGAYPIGPDEGIWHAWEVWGPISSDLWSMPSSHTSAAVVLAVFLRSIEPRLTWLWATLCVIVGAGRVVLGAHFLSDVLVGALFGLWLAPMVLRRIAAKRVA
ncbi:MAG: phosphatase PAP2 family protein [Planctomycetota bacterium]